MTTTGIQPRRLMTMTEDECWDRLRSCSVGRIAWSGDDGVSVVPVNFALDGETVLIRTTPYSLMARDCSGQEVGFEIDAIDEETHTGWNVLVRGRCERLDRAGDSPVPWANGSRVLGLRVVARTVSGRRLVSPDAARA